jgi:CBS domain-containing protein
MAGAVQLTAEMMDHVTRSTDLPIGGVDKTTDQDAPDTVRLYVSDDLISIEPAATLRQIAQRLNHEGVGALLVAEGDRVIGIISERDVVRAVASDKDLDSTTAGDLSTRHVVTCAPDATVQAAAQLMMEHYVRHLLVEDRSGPTGMISARDLLGAYAS